MALRCSVRTVAYDYAWESPAVTALFRADRRYFRPQHCQTFLRLLAVEVRPEAFTKVPDRCEALRLVADQ